VSRYSVYRSHQAWAWSRVDGLLALYDGAIDRLERAAALLDHGHVAEAAPLLVRASRIVVELMAGVRRDYSELSENLVRLYAFVLHRIRGGTAAELRDAIRVLSILKRGWEEIRPTALELERRGEIPPATSIQSVNLSA
jgi:flagellar protein FliS